MENPPQYPISDEEVLKLIQPHFRSPEVKGQYLTRFFMASFVWLCTIISWRMAAFLGNSLGKLACMFKVRKRVAMVNLELVFGDSKTRQEKEKIYRDSVLNLGLVLVNYLRVPRLDKRFWSENCQWKNRETLTDAFNRGKGVLMLAGHFGMYDLAAGMIGCSGYPFLGIGKRISNPAVNRFIIDARQRFNTVTLMNKGTMRVILDFLSKGLGVGMVVDQDVSRKRGIFVDWFGHQASTIRSSAYIAKKSGCAVVPVTFFQTGLDSFEMVVGEEIQWIDHPDDPEEEMRLNTLEHCRVLQEWILKKPEFWFWLHKRYKTQPDPEFDPYRQ